MKSSYDSCKRIMIDSRMIIDQHILNFILCFVFASIPFRSSLDWLDRCL